MATRLRVVDDPSTPGPQRPPDLRIEVADALLDMELKRSDRAMSGAAMRLAAEIEAAADRAEEYAALVEATKEDPVLAKRVARLEAQCDRTKVVGWLMPQLLGVIRELNPAAAQPRRSPAAPAPVDDAPKPRSALDQLRDDAAARVDHS